MKKFYFILIILSLSIPSFFQIVGRKNDKLEGYYNTTERPIASIKNIIKSDFQNNLEKYLKQKTGFADLLIRFSNQIRFRLLYSSTGKGVIIGQNNYIYTDGYINSHLGLFATDSLKTDLAVRKLTQVKDSLKAKGVDMVFMMCPGKGTFYPEYLPYRYKRLKQRTPYSKTFINLFNHYGIEYLDFNSWLISLKEKSKYGIYSNTSVHWGQYPCYLAVDSLTKFLDKKYHIDLPKIRIKDIKVSKKMYGSDDDAERLVNCLEDIPNEPMPKIDFYYDTINKDKLRVLSMGDSYFFGLQDMGLLHYLFYESEFWYYFKEVRKKEYKYQLVSEYDDLKNEIEKNKLILIIFTEANNNYILNCFDELYYLYCSKKDNDKELLKHTERYIKLIKGDKNWLKSIEKKAIDKGISLEEAIEIDAEYMAKEYLKENMK